MKYIVKTRYEDFEFDLGLKALAFAESATKHSKESASVNIEVIDDDAEFPNAPKTIRMEYLTLDDVLSDKGGIAYDILRYRGLYNLDVQDIHYGDIMMYLGEIVDNN